MAKQKHFYKVFSILYKNLVAGVSTDQKEEFYRLIFDKSYKEVGYDYIDNDGIRKVTSGNMPIHRKVSKSIYSFDAFERLLGLLMVIWETPLVIAIAMKQRCIFFARQSDCKGMVGCIKTQYGYKVFLGGTELIYITDFL